MDSINDYLRRLCGAPSPRRTVNFALERFAEAQSFGTAHFMTIACPDCGTLEELPPLPPNSRSLCAICDGRLELTSGRTITGALGCALGTFLLLFPANLAPLMSVTLLGMRREDRLGSGVIAVWHEGWPVLAIAVGLFAVILPFIRFGLLSAVLGAIYLGRRPLWLGWAFRWSMWLDLWAMQDVFLLGCFVGYSRIAANLNVTIEAGGYCFIAAALLSMISRAALDRRTVWREITPNRTVPLLANNSRVISCTTCDLVMPVTSEGQRCPRCGARLTARKTDSLVRTVALIITGFILFWPANFFPMNVAFQGGNYVSYRIIDGVRELFRAGLAPLGILIFCTSIAIPVVKILGLAWCVSSVVRRSPKHLVVKTRLYRLIDELGRWSNMDPFTIAVFVPLMHFDSLVSSQAAPGATPFILVVVFTMFASIAFDPRLMWDAAEENH